MSYNTRPKRSRTPNYAATRADYAPSLAHRAMTSAAEGIAVAMLMVMAAGRAPNDAKYPETPARRQLQFGSLTATGSAERGTSNSSLSSSSANSTSSFSAPFSSSFSASFSASFSSSSATSSRPHLSASRARGRNKRARRSSPVVFVNLGAGAVVETGSSYSSEADAMLLWGMRRSNSSSSIGSGSSGCSSSSSSGGGGGGGSNSGGGGGGSSSSGGGGGGGGGGGSGGSSNLTKRGRSSEDDEFAEASGAERQVKKSKQ